VSPGRRGRYVDRRATILAELREIDELVLLAGEQQDVDIRGHLARLAVIRLSGFVEFSLRNMLNGYLDENSSHRVLAFAQSQVGRLPNLNPARLEEIVGAFDSSWKQELTDFLAVDERRQALANLIGVRHTLAHGGSTAVSTSRLGVYHEIADATVRFLMDRFLPIPSAVDGGPSRQPPSTPSS
jgi:hypothetical protein